jgi:hypothetical protein
MATKKIIAVDDFGIVKQVKTAFKSGNRLATLIGCLLGGFVPLASYVTAHQNMGSTSVKAMCFTMVSGGLVYSAKTVFDWAMLAFNNVFKSLGLCILIEGVMVTSTVTWLSMIALVYLIFINGISTGCRLSVKN